MSGRYYFVWVCMGMYRYLWVYRGMNGYIWVNRGLYGYVWECKSGQVENWKIVKVKNWISGNLEC